MCRKDTDGSVWTTKKTLLFRYEQAKNTYNTDVEDVNEPRIFITSYVLFIWVN